MRNPLKITDPEQTFFTSDLHFGHGLEVLLANRGYKDVDEMNAALIQRWNQKVPPEATVFCLGDFILHDPDGSLARAILGKLHYRRLYMLWGNHSSGGVRALYRKEKTRLLPDSKFERFFERFEIYPVNAHFKGRRVVTFCGDNLDLRWGNRKIVLCHYAFRNWHHNNRGSWMLCGHSHGNDPGTHPATGIGRILDVGIDSVGEPLSLAEIAEILDTRPIVAPDVHRPADYDFNG